MKKAKTEWKLADGRTLRAGTEYAITGTEYVGRLERQNEITGKFVMAVNGGSISIQVPAERLVEVP